MNIPETDVVHLALDGPRLLVTGFLSTNCEPKYRLVVLDATTGKQLSEGPANPNLPPDDTNVTVAAGGLKYGVSQGAVHTQCSD